MAPASNICDDCHTRLEKRDSKTRLIEASLEEEVAMMSLSCTGGHLMIKPFKLAVFLA
jgi:hypothetical protein